MHERGSKLYLLDIKTAIEKIESYVRGWSFEAFAENSEKIDSVVRNFEIIGEAAAAIPKEVIEGHPEIPWVEIISMRNKMIHEYFGVDEEILWKTIRDDLPLFKNQIENILKDYE